MRQDAPINRKNRWMKRSGVTIYEPHGKTQWSTSTLAFDLPTDDLARRLGALPARNFSGVMAKCLPEMHGAGRERAAPVLRRDHGGNDQDFIWNVGTVSRPRC